jgi:hypothetical protein
MANFKVNFSATDLNVDYQLEVEHNLNTRDVVPIWYNEEGIQQATFGIFQTVDANNVVLNCNDTITGSHTLILQYDAETPVIAGTRLFEKTLQDPQDDSVFAHGGDGVPTYNIKWSVIKSLLYSALNFLKKENNLSDILDATAARSNLGVYSASQVNTLLAPKAELYQASSGAVLGVANTKPYTATGNYYPATQKFVADKILPVSLSANVDYSVKHASLTVDYLRTWKSGNTIIVSGRIICSAASIGTYLNIFKFDNSSLYPSTGNYWYSTAAPWNGTNRNPATIRINDAGIVAIAPGSASDIEYYVFELIYFAV